jgi:hypothetical protein
MLGSGDSNQVVKGYTISNKMFERSNLTHVFLLRAVALSLSV